MKRIIPPLLKIYSVGIQMMNLFVWVCIIKGLTISVSLRPKSYVSGSQTSGSIKIT